MPPGSASDEYQQYMLSRRAKKNIMTILVKKISLSNYSCEMNRLVWAFAVYIMFSVDIMLCSG